MKIVAIGLLAGTSPIAAAAAQGATRPTNVRQVGTADEIIVTGSRVAERTVTTSPVPIDLLRGDELRASGYQETSEVLRQLAPSFAFANPTTPDGNTHIHSASLRGLSPDETLVLLNGKRLHSAAWVNTGGTIGKGATPTDLNQIPAASIGRIEILRDGASAQYGSDAIAGVINILLRTDTALHGLASAGTTYDGGGDTYQFSLGGGLKLGEDGFVNLTGHYRDHRAANRAQSHRLDRCDRGCGGPCRRAGRTGRAQPWLPRHRLVGDAGSVSAPGEDFGCDAGRAARCGPTGLRPSAAPFRTGAIRRAAVPDAVDSQRQRSLCGPCPVAGPGPRLGGDLRRHRPGRTHQRCVEAGRLGAWTGVARVAGRRFDRIDIADNIKVPLPIVMQLIRHHGTALSIDPA